MTNLIPPDAKQRVKKEYWIRVVSVWGILLAICFVIFTALLFPTYVLFNTQLDALATEISREENERAAEYAAAEEAMAVANDTADQLIDVSRASGALELLQAVEAVLTPEITLDSFAYDRKGEKLNSITIQGTAANRTSLAAFAEALKRSPHFTQAEVPVSSLVRDSDLPFSINVVVTPPSKK